MKTNNKGFSLVELIVVIAIMAILAAVAIPTFATFINKANVASDVSFINDLEYSAQLAHTATGDKLVANSVKVTLNDKGEITGAEYTIDRTADVTVKISKSEGVWTVTECSDAELKKDAQATIDTIDWTYKFKSTKKAGECQIDTTDAKKLSGTATTN